VRGEGMGEARILAWRVGECTAKQSQANRIESNRNLTSMKRYSGQIGRRSAAIISTATIANRIVMPKERRSPERTSIQKGEKERNVNKMLGTIIFMT